MKNIADLGAVVSRDGELILVCDTEFSVLFYPITAVHKFHSRLVTNEKTNKRRPVVLGWLYMYSPQALAAHEGPPTHAVKAKTLLLINDY